MFEHADQRGALVVKADDEFTFGKKGPPNLGDFDVEKIKDRDMWETWVLTFVMHALFIVGLVLVGFLALITGRRDG